MQASDNRSRVLASVQALYNRYGYRPYRMNKFEEYDLYARNKDFLISDSVITFTDLYHFTKALMLDGEVYGEHDHVHFCDEVRKLQAAYIAGAVLRIVE